VALFQGTAEVPTIEGFEREGVQTLPRGDHNYLVQLRVPRGTS